MRNKAGSISHPGGGRDRVAPAETPARRPGSDPEGLVSWLLIAIFGLVVLVGPWLV